MLHATLLFGLQSSLAQKGLHIQHRLPRRYERGSKINEMSHVLDLRHVVGRLSALM